jgi:chromosomal replication initiator protein
MQIEINELELNKLLNNEVTYSLFKKARKVKSNLLKNKNVSWIVKECCDYWGIENYDLIFKKYKKEEYVWCRQIAMYFLHVYQKQSLSSIKKVFDKKQHGTVKYAVNKVRTCNVLSRHYINIFGIKPI